MRSIDEILDSIKDLKNIKTDKELADVLGVAQSTLTTWRQRKNVPYETLFQFCVSNDIDFVWLITGVHTKLVYMKNGKIHWDLSDKGRADKPSGEEDIINASALQTIHLPEIRPVFEAFIEVMTSGEKGTIQALTQNVYEFRESVNNKKEIAAMKKDMDAIKRRLFAEPLEADFKTQGTPGENEHPENKHHAGGK